jgi:hypothetical protein
MIRYTEEKKAAVLKRMMPPERCSVSKLSTELGISESCLYYWQMKARQKGTLMPDSKQPPEQWSSVSKFTVVLETARMSEVELSAWCRQKGLYVEQVKMWRQICEDANQRAEKMGIDSRKESKNDKQRIQALERELQRKEKALAEAAALLILRKKLDAFYSEAEDT